MNQNKKVETSKLGIVEVEIEGDAPVDETEKIQENNKEEFQFGSGVKIAINSKSNPSKIDISETPIVEVPTVIGNTKDSNNTKTTNSTLTSKDGTKTNNEEWVRLSHLKQLYDEGFITVTEYKERKSQLVDNLTGTKSSKSINSVSSSLSNTGNSILRQEYVPPRKPNFDGIKPEKAIKYTFDPKTGEWSQKTIQIIVEKETFAKGGLRQAFYLKYVNPKDADLETDLSPNDQNDLYVAKMSNNPNEDREIYLADVEMQMYAREWAAKYNKFNPPKRVQFIKASVLELIERQSTPLCGVEKFINGIYVIFL